MTTGVKTQKLIQYQQTQNLLQGINAQGQLPPDQTIQSSSFTALHKLRTDFDQRTLMRSHLETLIEVLDKHEKQTGIPDSLKSEYSRLLNRINLDPEKVSLSEFENAIKKFSSSSEYTVALQDEINNKNLDLEINPEEAEESGQPSGIADSSESDQEGDQMPGQEPGGQEESSESQQRQVSRTPGRRMIIQKPQKPQYGMTKEEYAKYKEEHKEERDARARQLWEERRKRRDGEEKEEEDEKKRPRKSSEQQDSGKNRLQRKLDNWVKNKFNNSRLGKSLQRFNERFGNTRLGRGLTRVNNILNAPFRFVNNLLARAGNWLGNVTGYTRLNNFLSGIGKSLSSWAGNTLRSLASQAGRFLLNGASRVLANLGSQAAGGVARTAVGTVGRGALLLLANPITWVVLGVAGLFLFTWWYDNLIGNSECNKPVGVMKIVKKADNLVQPKLKYEPGEQINYVIQVTHDLACRTRTLPSVVVTDKIPADTEYVKESAKSGFYNTRGTGPDGVYDDATRTVTWTFQNFPTDNPAYILFSVQPDPDKQDFWVVNEATVRYTLAGISGGKIIASQSQSLEPAFVAAAQNANIPTPLLKAIAKTEAPKVFDYNEEEFLRFSVPGWWEGLIDNAPTLAQNDPNVIRGYAYNTCAYRNDCAAGADVRGVTQFELATWSGIAGNLKFSDSHQPDRRNASDAIYGSAILNRRNAESYVGSSIIEWTEDVVRAVARMYCGGAAAGKDPSRSRVSACGWNGSMGYDDFVWRDYKIFTGQP